MEYLQYLKKQNSSIHLLSFKPYYKWNTFNTPKEGSILSYEDLVVLNLIINGIPSILTRESLMKEKVEVLNLIINGIPSILLLATYARQ